MEYYVVNQNQTLLITRNPEDNGFILKRISATSDFENVFLEDKCFFGNSFKYPSDFLKTFTQSFRDKPYVTKFVVTTQASDAILRIMDFNRIDTDC